MRKSKIIYVEDQEVIGKHLQSNEWICYTGKLKIYDRKTNPITLSLKSEVYDSVFDEFLDKIKEFKGSSLSQVFGKVAKWYYRKGIIFQN